MASPLYNRPIFAKLLAAKFRFEPLTSIPINFYE